LPLPQHMLLQAALQVPALILQPQHTVSARLAESARALGLRSHQVKASRRGQTVQLHWRLLLMQTQQLERQLDQLSQLLGGLPRPHVVQLVCAEPRLLEVEPPQLLSTVEALEQVRDRHCGQSCTAWFPACILESQLQLQQASQVAVCAHSCAEANLLGQLSNTAVLCVCLSCCCRSVGAGWIGCCHSCGVTGGCWAALQTACTRQQLGCSRC
jgi:hypothetical protein